MVRYTRFVTAVAFVLLALPCCAFAQPVPPRPPIPAMPAVPPAAPLAPMPPEPLMFYFDDFKMDKELFKVDMDRWKADMEIFKKDLQDSFKNDFLFEFSQAPKPGPVPIPKVVITRGDNRGDNNEDRNYQNGMRALDAGRWDEAVEYFTRVANQKHARRRRMYWCLGVEQTRQQCSSARVARTTAKDVCGKPLAHRRACARIGNSPTRGPAGQT